MLGRYPSKGDQPRLNMGNKVPTILPLTAEQQACIGGEYRTLVPLYLQTALLLDHRLTPKALTAEECGTDPKFSIRQYELPADSLLTVTHAAIPNNQLGLGYFAPVKQQLCATLRVPGRPTLEGVVVDDIINTSFITRV